MCSKTYAHLLELFLIVYIILFTGVYNADRPTHTFYTRQAQIINRQNIITPLFFVFYATSFLIDKRVSNYHYCASYIKETGKKQHSSAVIHVISYYHITALDKHQALIIFYIRPCIGFVELFFCIGWVTVDLA